MGERENDITARDESRLSLREAREQDRRDAADAAAIAAALTPAMRTMLLTGMPPTVNGMQTTAALCRRGLYATQRPARGGMLTSLGRRVRAQLQLLAPAETEVAQLARLTVEWEALAERPVPHAVSSAGQPNETGFETVASAIRWLTGNLARLQARQQAGPAPTATERVTRRTAYNVLTTLDRAVAAWVDMFHENHQAMDRRGLVDETFTAADIRVMLTDAAREHGIEAQWSARLAD